MKLAVEIETSLPLSKVRAIIHNALMAVPLIHKVKVRSYIKDYDEDVLQEMQAGHLIETNLREKIYAKENRAKSGNARKHRKNHVSRAGTHFSE